MELNEAIKAHVEWLISLVDLLEEGADDRLVDPQHIRNQYSCRIGQWLLCQEAHLAKVPEFMKLKQEHALLHAHAAEIFEIHREIGYLDAVQRLESLSGKASDNLILCFADLLDRLAEIGDLAGGRDGPASPVLKQLLKRV